jgi:parallel beta-helix repeat protein
MDILRGAPERLISRGAVSFTIVALGLAALGASDIAPPTNLYFVTQYYAATNGSSTNSGLSPDSAWPLQFGLDHLGPGVTLIVLPGAYTGPFSIVRIDGTASRPAIVRSQQKWQAVIADSSARGLVCNLSQYVIVDGLCISNSVQDGVKLLSAQTTVRNCWITRNGNTTDEQGIASNSAGNSNNIVEYNLIEYNGAGAGYGHGLYLSGPNNIVRGNVVRNNGAFGIQLYTALTNVLQDNNQIYNNLVYGHTNRYGVTMWGAVDPTGLPSGTNYLFNNTILDGMSVFYGSAELTNNIILPAAIKPTSPIDYSATRPALIQSDYNLGTNTISPPGAHNVIINVDPAALFVKPSYGLYWLSQASPARGRAANIGPIRDFFNNPEPVVSDIGAFPYLDALTNDVRNLEAPSGSPDYWFLKE